MTLSHNIEDGDYVFFWYTVYNMVVSAAVHEMDCYNVHVQEMKQIALNARLLETAGLSLSLVALSISAFIFFRFRFVIIIAAVN